MWARRPNQDAWIFVLEESVDLRRLNFIGTLLDRRFLHNALVFHLEDGPYSLDFATRPADPKQAPPAATSSYKALMKLAHLESSVRDALDTQQRLMAQIDSMLRQSPPGAAEAAQQEVARAAKYLARQRRANRLAEERRRELRASLSARRAAMAAGRAAQARADEDMAGRRAGLEASGQKLRRVQEQMRGQRRRICAELCDIFPITAAPRAPPLSFRICGLPLPNSVYDAATARAVDEDGLSAALGLAALLTRHLQLYLSSPLPYPLHARGSRSLARDDISRLPDKQRREFPLFLPRGGSTAGRWRFDYGWFLLNKDIEALCAAQGLRVVDIHHSLPNLKYLLCVCSAGPPDVPRRKQGGVRGLCAASAAAAGPHIPSPAADSASAPAPGPDGSDGPNSRAAPPGAAGLPFGGADARLSLHTKGLREDVAG